MLPAEICSSPPTKRQAVEYDTEDNASSAMWVPYNPHTAAAATTGDNPTLSDLVFRTNAITTNGASLSMIGATIQGPPSGSWGGPLDEFIKASNKGGSPADSDTDSKGDS